MTTILIIEDNPSHLKLATLLLKRFGYAVLGAADADEGLRLAHEKQPDLILMDIQLPGMDGLAATRELKRARRRLRQLHRQALPPRRAAGGGEGGAGGVMWGTGGRLCRTRPVVKRFRRDIDLARPDDRAIVDIGLGKQG